MAIPATPSLTLDNPTDQAGGRFGVSVASASDANRCGDVVGGVEDRWNHCGWVDLRFNAGPWSVWVRMEKTRGGKLTLTRD